METMNDNLSFWINKRLEETGWSIRELARRASISHSYMARIVNGEVIPGTDICVAIAKAFNVPTETVLRLIGVLSEVDQNEAETEALLAQWKLLSREDRRTAYLMLKSLNEAREQRERERA